MVVVEQLSKKYNTLLNKYNINTPIRLAYFFAQCLHESGLKLTRENMNYSAKRIIEIFKARVDRNKDGWLNDVEKTKIRELANSPIKLANFIYADRFGNGSESSGDGFKYRAGGFLGTTFKDNYRDLEKATGIKCVDNPDLLLQETNALISALHFWQKNNLNKFSDLDDIKGSTKIINGGYNGLEDRVKHLKTCKKIFK